MAELVAMVETYNEFPNPLEWFEKLEYKEKDRKRFNRKYNTGKFFSRIIKGKTLVILQDFIYYKENNWKGFIQAIKDNR